MNKKPTYEELETKIKELENSLSLMDSLKYDIKVNNFFLKNYLIRFLIQFFIKIKMVFISIVMTLSQKQFWVFQKKKL